jgi:hypothetical protein
MAAKKDAAVRGRRKNDAIVKESTIKKEEKPKKGSRQYQRKNPHVTFENAEELKERFDENQDESRTQDKHFHKLFDDLFKRCKSFIDRKKKDDVSSDSDSSTDSSSDSDSHVE